MTNPDIGMLRVKLSEDDLANLVGLSLAIEVCSDVIMGAIDEQTARNALPTLVRLHKAEIDSIWNNFESARMEANT